MERIVSKFEGGPIKIIHNDSNCNIEPFKESIENILLEILKLLWSLSKITRHQYRSERGKLRNNNYSEIMNFVIKRGFDKEYIERKLREEKFRIVIREKIQTDFDLKMGIVNLSGL